MFTQTLEQSPKNRRGAGEFAYHPADSSPNRA